MDNPFIGILIAVYKAIMAVIKYLTTRMIYFILMKHICYNDKMLIGRN